MMRIDAARKAGLTIVVVSIVNFAEVSMSSGSYGRTNYFTKLTILQVSRRKVILRRQSAAQTANERLPEPAGIYSGRDHHEAD
jgi:hypothetical protein